MSTPASPDHDHGPLIEPAPSAAYTLDIIASACGMDSQTVIHYHEQGLIAPVAQDDSGAALYDDESLHRLRRIEHLRENYALESSALRLTLDLMDEVERLRAELRHRR
jgi:DNA-binding transcriptional MerR regulator